MNHGLSLKPIAVAMVSVLVLQGCATTTGAGSGERSMSDTLKDTFDNDDPCANSKRNIGIAAGALLGAALGAASGDKNTLARVLVGAGVGAGLGALIGHEIDNRQCEISKLQKKYDVDIRMTQLTQTDTSGKQAVSLSQPQQSVGLSVSVIDKAMKPQFASNSAELSADSRAMFEDIAKTYVPKSDEEGRGIREAQKSRRILLVGHTDDTGSSALNADLSERRAKTVARLFEKAGLENQIFYQGAGETFPIADNSTEAGRAKNRRVEIVDLSDEKAFRTYLENRRPNTAFYRPADKGGPVAADGIHKPANASQPVVKVNANTKVGNSKSTTAANAPAVSVAKASRMPVSAQSANMARTSAPIQRKRTADGKILDFGGKPFTQEGARINTGSLAAERHSSFSLIGEAHASDIARIETCNVDRPRNTGRVRSLKDGTVYKTSEYLPGMYGRTWYDMVGNNLVVLNKVSVLRDGATPANKPELKVYSNYRSNAKNPVPVVFSKPEVNAYQTSNGLLYRVFANGDHGVQCIDILMPVDNVRVAKDGRLIYGNGPEFVSGFKPKLKN